MRNLHGSDRPHRRDRAAAAGSEQHQAGSWHPEAHDGAHIGRPGLASQQIIWVGAATTAFAGICESCLADPERPPEALGYRAAKVEGSLRREADVGFIRCRRGHRLSVKRADRIPLARRQDEHHETRLEGSPAWLVSRGPA